MAHSVLGSDRAPDIFPAPVAHNWNGRPSVGPMCLWRPTHISRNAALNRELLSAVQENEGCWSSRHTFLRGSVPLLLLFPGVGLPSTCFPNYTGQNLGVSWDASVTPLSQGRPMAEALQRPPNLYSLACISGVPSLVHTLLPTESSVIL